MTCIQVTKITPIFGLNDTIQEKNLNTALSVGEDLEKRFLLIYY